MFKRVEIALVLAMLPSILLAGALDGTKWQMREKGVRFLSTDELIFVNDQFLSDASRKSGFRTSDYSASKNDPWVSWNAIQTNDKGDKMEWYGVSNGLQMDGSYTLSKPSGEAVIRQWQADLERP